MASTFSPILRIELIGTGDQSGTWGITTNTNLGTLIEQAIAGVANIDVTAGNVTLTNLNGTSDEARCMVLRVTGTPGVSRNIIAPAVSKTYVINNNSDSSVVIKTSTSTGVTLSTGEIALVVYDVISTDFKLVGKPYTSANTPNTLVLRNASGNFSAGQITGTAFVGGSGSFTTVNASGTGTFNAVVTDGLNNTGNTTLGDTLLDTLTVNATPTFNVPIPVASGGTGATTASAARTALGATTVGGNFYTLTNPSAIRFVQINADNSVSTLDAASFRTAIGAGSGGGSVTSITAGSFLTGGTITTSGTIAVDATSSNTASKVVARDASGNFSAGTITGVHAGSIASSTTATTQVAGTNDTTIATTAFVATANSALIPVGVIVMWSGSIASVPTGWRLCNGLNGTPDLRNRFIVGAFQDVGGVANTTITGGNTTTGGSKDATLVSHSHTASVTDPGHAHTTTPSTSFLRASAGGNGSNSGSNWRNDTLVVNSNTTGITVTNSTEGSSGTNANLVPYYALAFIMKV